MTNYDSHLLFKELINREEPFVPFNFSLKTDGRVISITSGRSGLIDSLTFINMSVDTIVKAVGKNEKSLR